MIKTSERLLTMLSMLQSRRDWPGTVLAERLDVSPRTVRRDVDRLRELGYTIAAVKGPDGGYRLEPGTELPPLMFDDDQAVAVAVALRTAVGGATGADVEEAAARALATIRHVMPSRLRHRLDALTVTAVPRPSALPSPRADPTLLMTLSSLIRASETLRFDYASPAGEAAAGPARRAEPVHLVTWNGRWYLVAWDLDRDDWRTFRVDRITPRTPNGPRFSPRELPGGDVSAFVTSTFRGSTDGSGQWPCRGEVVLDMPAAEVLTYHPDAVAESLPDGRCRVVLGAWSWIALAASIGQLDADVEVVGPPELRAAFDRLAARFA